jgi:hypothetical protein
MKDKSKTSNTAHHLKVLLLDADNGFYRMQRYRVGDFFGPVDLGIHLAFKHNALAIGAGLLAGSVFPGSNRLVVAKNNKHARRVLSLREDANFSSGQAMAELDEVKKEVNGLLAQKKCAEARELFSELPAPDIAGFLPDLDKADRVLMFRLLPRPLASEVFSYLEPKKKDDLLRGLTEEEARRVLSGLSPDDRTDFFEELPGEATEDFHRVAAVVPLKQAIGKQGYGRSFGSELDGSRV